MSIYHRVQGQSSCAFFLLFKKGKRRTSLSLLPRVLLLFLLLLLLMLVVAMLGMRMRMKRRRRVITLLKVAACNLYSGNSLSSPGIAVLVMMVVRLKVVRRRRRRLLMLVLVLVPVLVLQGEMRMLTSSMWMRGGRIVDLRILVKLAWIPGQVSERWNIL